MAEKAYRVKVGAFAGAVEGDVLRPSELEHIPRERFRELAGRGVLEELSADEAAILATNQADSDREAGAVEDQFSDQTRGDALRLHARIEALEAAHGATRAERQALQTHVEDLRGQLAEMRAALEARSVGQEEQARQAAAASGVSLPETEPRKK